MTTHGPYRRITETDPETGITVCGDCGDEIIKVSPGPPVSVWVHKDDHSPQCAGRRDATRRYPQRFPGEHYIAWQDSIWLLADTQYALAARCVCREVFAAMGPDEKGVRRRIERKLNRHNQRGREGRK